MKHYELMFILKADAEQEQKEEIVNRINDLLSKSHVEKVKEEHMGIQKLAYEIDKNTNGDYYLYYLKTENGPAINEMRESLNIIPGLIRYIFVKKDGFSFEAEA